MKKIVPQEGWKPELPDYYQRFYGINRRWLAERLGITCGWLSAVLNGTANPGPELSARMKSLANELLQNSTNA